MLVSAASCKKSVEKPLTFVDGSIARYVAELEQLASANGTSTRPVTAESLDLLESYASSPRSRIGVKAHQALLAGPAADAAEAVRQFVFSKQASDTERAVAAALLASFPGSVQAAECAVAIVSDLTLDPATRQAASTAIGAIDVPSTIPGLLLTLKNEKSELVFATSVRSLAVLGNLAGIEDLRGVVRRGNCPEAPAIAAEIVAGEGLTLQAGLDSASIDAHLFALSEQWWREGEGARSVKAPDARLRLAFARFAANLGLRDLRPVDDARYVLARGGKLSLECLTHALADAALYTRVRAIEVAGALGPAARSLAETLTELARHPEHRAEPLVALGRIRDRRATPALVQALLDRDLDVRVAAARGLAVLEDPAAKDALAAALEANRPGARGASADLALLTADALAALGDFRGVPVLVDLAASPAVEPGALEAALTRAFGRIRAAEGDDGGFGAATTATERLEAARRWVNLRRR